MAAGDAPPEVATTSLVTVGWQPQGAVPGVGITLVPGPGTTAFRGVSSPFRGLRRQRLNCLRCEDLSEAEREGAFGGGVAKELRAPLLLVDLTDLAGCAAQRGQ